jgi:hypothetical protein
MPTANRSVIHVRRLGNLGNRMMQFMTAYAIASQIDGAVISNVYLPEWGLVWDEIDEAPRDAVTFGHAHEERNQGNIDVAGLVAALRRAAISRVNLSHYCQNVRNFLPHLSYLPLFPPDHSLVGTGIDELLINIRLGDISAGEHLDYVLLPAEYYRALIETTGLRPVFLGQLDDGPYLQQLRAMFPTARFIPSRGTVADFQIIRCSCNIVLAVSTFSWCAAWLSHARRIIMPVAGLFHPMQSRSCNLLPLDDPRYEFWLFPVYQASLSQIDAIAFHKSIRDLWRAVPPTFLRDLGRASRYDRVKADFIATFDEQYYLDSYDDVRSGVIDGTIKSGLTHYVTNGFDENRPAFALAMNDYFGRYSLAAIEVSQGDYLNAHHHFVAVGRKRGYQIG